MTDAIVVGAGLAGLTAAWRLTQRGLDVLVVDAATRVGGCIASHRQGPFLFEGGPNSMRGSSLALSSLVHGLHLDQARIDANPSERHAWIWRHGERHALPSSPPSLLRSRLLSPAGKARLFAEPFVPRWKGPASASIADFLTQRLGAEAVAALVDPFMSGVFAGDPAHLGLDAFEFIAAAARSGGILRGVLAQRNAPGRGGGKSRGPRATSFREGLETLPQALAAAIGPARLRLGTAVQSLRLDQAPAAGHAPRHALTLADGTTLAAPRLVLAVPPAALARLLDEPALTIETASVATVGLGLRLADLAAPLDGFGVLVASDSPLGEVIGVVFGSCVFAGRAPDNHVALTCILGGVRHPQAVTRPDDELVAASLGALQRLFGSGSGGARIEPLATHVTRWRDGIPQIPPGHRAAVKALRERLPRTVALAGAAVDGPGLDPVATGGLRAADQVV